MISIITVNYHTLPQIGRMLESLFVQQTSSQREIFVVNNALDENTNELQNRFPSVHFLQAPKNLGFAGGCNFGIAQANGDFFLLVNPDIEFDSDAPGEIETAMQQDQNVGVGGISLKNLDGTQQDCVWHFPTPLDQLLLLLKIPHLFPNMASIRRWLMKGFDYTKTTPGWKRNYDIEQKLPDAAFSESGSDFGVRLADINRDGMTDFINSKDIWLSSHYSVLQDANGNYAQNSIFAPPENANFVGSINIDFEYDGGVRLGDINGDGYPDLIKGLRDDDNNIKYNDVWLGSSNGWTHSSIYVPITFSKVDYLGGGVYSHEGYGVEIDDLNGDGKSDLIIAKEGQSKSTYLSYGDYFSQVSNWNIPSGNFVDSSDRDLGLRLIDVNADGLPDLLQVDKNNIMHLWLNTGNGWEQNDGFFNLVPPRFVDTGYDDEGVRFADINDDGMPDILQASSSSSRNTYLNAGNTWIIDSSWNVPPIAEFVYIDGSNKGTVLFDADTDGTLDIVKIQSTNGFVTKTAWSSLNKMSNILKEVTLASK